MSEASAKVEATISPDAAAPPGKKWYAIIVGAGPAGSAAAISLARGGRAVLLVDKAAFPRGKVCGCCLNATALQALADLGLGDLATRLGAPVQRELMLAAGGSVVSIPLTQGAALSREKLDAALVVRAIEAGAHFLPRTLALAGGVTKEHRAVRLRVDGREFTAAASVVLAADGLAGTFLGPEAGFAPRGARNSFMGVGAVVAGDAVGAASFYRPGVIYMACGQGGYVGLTRLEDGRLDIAAALSPGRARAAGGPAGLVGAILGSAGFPLPCALAGLAWHGTPPLTRCRQIAGDRLLVLGDAAGYIEPFTGEGIGWALTAGEAVAGLIHAAGGWLPGLMRAWPVEYRRLFRRKQWVCRLVTRGLHHPGLTRAVVTVLAHAPRLARPLVRGISSVPLVSANGC